MKWDVDALVDLLLEMDIGIGAYSFVCRMSSLPRRPTVELTTDGFMICYGVFVGLHIYREGDKIYCTRMDGKNTETCEIGDQFLAGEIYDHLIAELLAA